MDFDGARKILEKVKSISDSAVVVAATKTVPATIMNQIKKELNIDIVGENRVQELLSKYDEARECKRWHFIGQLQTNKVKYIADKVELIQSCDRLSLCEEIERQCAKLSKTMSVFLEVNMAQEQTKGGVNAENLVEFCEKVSTFSHIKVEGVMSVLPNLEDKNLLRAYYKKLYLAFDELKRANIQNTEVKFLSAGMSGDWEIALESGANMIRLGSALFGKRIY